MPLFTNVDDLMTSWNRLEKEAGADEKSPTIQVGEVAAHAGMIPLPMPHYSS